jgi:diadenosine tetraphosphate (Ap4A) HIT family hydrolase
MPALQTALHAGGKIAALLVLTQVSQLHIHVTGRLQTDPSWPGPCYGAVPAKPLGQETATAMVKALREYFVQ